MIYPGAGRQVYPGFLQLAGFMAMNLGSHLDSHWEMFKHLVQGDGESADATKDFYDEYRSVCDMTAEFYLQTIDVVFQRHALPKGEMTHRGRLVDPAAITRHRAARDRGRARRYFGARPDQGGARPGDRPARGDEAVLHRRDGRPLRHLQRQRSGARASRPSSSAGSPRTAADPGVENDPLVSSEVEKPRRSASRPFLDYARNERQRGAPRDPENGSGSRSPSR